MPRRVWITLMIVCGSVPAGFALLIAWRGGAGNAMEPLHAQPAASADAPDMQRCRTAPQPDAACAAAWEARRRHFFGRDERR